MKKLLPFLILILFLLPIAISAQYYIFDFDTVGTHFAGDTIIITIHGHDSLNSPYNSIAELHMTSPERITILDYYNAPPMIRFNAAGDYQGRIMIKRASDSLELYVTIPIGTAENNCPPFTILPGKANRLQIILPGQENDAGNTNNRGRKWIAPFDCTAGISFDATIYITDEYWNPRNTGNDTVSFGSSNSFPILPPDTFLTNGSDTLPFILRTASANQTISVSKPSFI
ncbi:MAG: hypothetical protein E3J87_11185, partial [Candidatus Cloacimonadota bacterium]